MNILGIFLIIAAGLPILLFFRHLKDKAIRRAALFKLHAVRDDFICLVAEGKLEENSKIFQYYYSRINGLLRSAPHVGLDHAMDAILKLQNNRDLEKSLKEAHRIAAQMRRLAEATDEDVSKVIANYYAASKLIALAHSSVLRMLYIIIVKYHFLQISNKFLSVDTKKFMKVVHFAASEENKFRGISNHHNPAF